MQPQREDGRSSPTVRLIASHPALDDNRGGATAKLLWREMLELAGGRSGIVRATEACLAERIGKKGPRSLWSSKGSPGPMDRLIAIGAVERDGDAVWFVRSPNEVGTPRRAAPPDPQQLLIADATGEPPQPPLHGPRVIRLPSQRGGFRPESPDANGGKGGQSALQEEQEQETSSCSSITAGESAGNPPATWRSVRLRLVAAGVYVKVVERVLRLAEQNNATAADVAGLCDYFEANPDRLDLNAGALAVAVESWCPRLSYDAPGLWPQTKLPHDPAHRPSVSDLGDEREHRRNLIVRDMRGRSAVEINAVLVAAGFSPIVAQEQIAARPVRLSSGRVGDQSPGNAH